MSPVFNCPKTNPFGVRSCIGAKHQSFMISTEVQPKCFHRVDIAISVEYLVKL
jgi:hypothetical protein